MSGIDGVNFRMRRYPVVCDVESGQVAFDNFGGRRGKQEELDRLFQNYAIEKTTLEARKQGHSVHEQALENGSVGVGVQQRGSKIRKKIGRIGRDLSRTFLWEAAQNAFRKIEATLGPKARKYLDRVAEAFHETNFGVSDYAAHAETIDSLLVGIEDRKVVFITYRSQRSTEPVTDDVHPYSLTRHRDTLYLLGFKPEDNAFRTWKVNRIESAQVDSMPFNRRSDFKAEQFLAGSLGIYHDTGDINLAIRFSSEVARYVEESQWHSSQQCERQADGSLLVRLDLSGTTEVKSWVLSFRRHAEVLEPSELRSELQGELAAALKLYSNDRSLSLRSRGKEQLRKAR